MEEYNFRINLQRKVLAKVNEMNLKEELSGLSSSTLDRFKVSNPNVSLSIIDLLKEISNSLFFLSTKSQEQISESYNNTTFEIDHLFNKLIEAIDEDQG